MHQIEQSAVRNRLLAALPPDAFARLVDHLQSAELELKQVLYEPGQKIRALYFPEGGLVSHVTPLENGHGVEVGVVGREGLVGLSALLGAERTTTEALVQMEANAWRIRPDELRAAFQQSAALRSVLLRYVHAFHVQVAQTAACNVQHAVDVRLARWLLMQHDRAEQDEFPMTHEFLALMLGARRPSISVAAAVLQKLGAVRYAHGRMTVLDRSRLEAAACECYGIVREQLGAPAG